MSVHRVETAERAPEETAALATRAGHAEADVALTPYEACLMPVLNGRGWPGDPRRFVEALPHFDPIATLLDLRVTLSHLGLRTEVSQRGLGDLAAEQFPCIVLREGAPEVVLRRLRSGLLQVFDPTTGVTEARETPRRPMQVCVIEAAAKEDPEADKAGWFRKAIRRFYADIATAVALSSLINLLTLATPLMSMAVYNNIAATGAVDSLIFLVFAALVALAYDNYLRWRRSQRIAEIGARLNAAIQREGFARLLMLPLQMTETASVSVQIARLKQFGNLLTVFTGNIATAFLDAPFTLIFLVVIALLGGWLVLIPLGLGAAFLLIGLLASPLARAQIRRASVSRLAAQELARQAIWERDAIRGLGAETLWEHRLQGALRQSARARAAAGSLEHLMHGAAQLLTSLAGVLTLIWGTLMVMQGDLSIGALIAVMMLVWRAMAPFQSVFLAANTLLNARDTVRQIDGLMNLPLDRDLSKPPSMPRRFRGEIAFDALSFRYPKALDWSLRGVAFQARPGQLIGVAGAVGSGKSTLLKLILGLYRPQSGGVYVDGLNLLQLDPGEVRAAFGYAGDEPRLFFGTVAQNIRLAHPAATDAEIVETLESLEVDLASPELPDGLATRLSSTQMAKMSESLLQRISLARALVKPAPVLLLDEPTALLSPSETSNVMALLEARKACATVLLVSSRRALLGSCDRLLYIRQGALAADGPPQNILPKLRDV